MKCRTLTLISAISLLAALALPVEVAAQHTRYKLIDIGALGGAVSYIAGNETGHRQLNNRGIVAGTADISTPDPNAGNPDLCLNPDCFFLSHAFLWQNGVLTDLGTLPGGNDSSANVINARGWIAGGSTTGEIDPLTGGPVFHAVFWKNEIIDLGTLGGNESGSNYVNNEGQVVGASAINTTSNPPTHPFLWENGVMLDLGTLGGPDAFPRQWLCKPTQRAGRRRLEYKLDSRPCYRTPAQRTLPLGERHYGQPRNFGGNPGRRGMREQPRSSHRRIESGR